VDGGQEGLTMRYQIADGSSDDVQRCWLAVVRMVDDAG